MTRILKVEFYFLSKYLGLNKIDLSQDNDFSKKFYRIIYRFVLVCIIYTAPFYFLIQNLVSYFFPKFLHPLIICNKPFFETSLTYTCIFYLVVFGSKSLALKIKINSSIAFTILSLLHGICFFKKTIYPILQIAFLNPSLLLNQFPFLQKLLKGNLSVLKKFSSLSSLVENLFIVLNNLFSFYYNITSFLAFLILMLSKYLIILVESFLFIALFYNALYFTLKNKNPEIPLISYLSNNFFISLYGVTKGTENKNDTF